MLPALVLPFHDSSGALLAQLTTIAPTLCKVFARAFLSLSPQTERLHAEQIQHLRHDPFFDYPATAGSIRLDVSWCDERIALMFPPLCLEQ